MARSLLWWIGVLGAACGARELDPAACSARFDVQRDKIIRTEESRDMGARYLSELDVGARSECLRLCCETDACDVFVYEEKGPGSCYLFNCGPPEDFRCKFTAHGNFSSGVLALSRRLAELQDQERLALASLRSASSAAPPPPPPPQPPPTRAPPPLAPPAATDLLLTAGKCSRYQFECRRGGECIAVYNACDGVPQCADASDEAPELGCPPPAAPAPAPLPTHPPPHSTTQRTLLRPLQESQEGMELEAASAAAAAAGERERERWPHRLAQAQPQHRYTDGGASGAPSSHIFSHKGGLLQEAEAAAPAAPYPPFEPPWPRRAWNQQQNMESMGGWGGGAYPRLEWGEGDARRAWPVPPPRPEPQEPMYVPPKSMGEVPPAYSARASTLRDSAKKGPELERGSPPAAPPPAPPRAPPAPPAATAPPAQHQAPPQHPRAPDPPPHNDKEAHAAGAGGAGGAAARVAPPDGLSERPPAAVLLLVLGMVMTVGLGGMLGCRMSAARRRLRRGKPFAHDADYLVNGMYL